MAARRVVIEFLGKDVGVSRAANEVEHSTSRMGSTLKHVGGILAGGLALDELKNGLVDCTKAALDEEASQRKLTPLSRSSPW
jgi:hypothetical protein